MGKCPRGWDVCTNRKSISHPTGEQLVQMMNDKVDEVIRKGAEKLHTLEGGERLKKIEHDPTKIEMDPGDRITLTLGEETYTPGSGGSFTVGPIQLSVTVREGENNDDAYLRAYYAASLMFEHQLEFKKREFFARTKEVNEKCQEESQSLSR